MMNLYNGVAVLDDRGEAEVKLPEYFEALNQDFRYQLTPIGGYAPVYVAREIKGNSFRIAGGVAGLKVSWQVTGIRHDAYANEHRIPVESEKPASEREPRLTNEQGLRLGKP
jgi:trimeric autotransporter adhesin